MSMKGTFSTNTYDVFVTYDVIDSQIKMICSISANNLESCIADNRKI